MRRTVTADGPVSSAELAAWRAKAAVAGGRTHVITPTAPSGDNYAYERCMDRDNDGWACEG